MRVETITRPLAASCTGRRVTVQVLDSDATCAYGWPDGSIFVTRGLVDVVDDAELAAAVAHELGHLLDDGHLASVACLKGCAEGADDESRADFRGRELLAANGFPPQAMSRALVKLLAAPSLPGPCRAAIAERVRRLEASDGQ